MFRTLGQTIARFWPVFLAAWILLVVAGWRYAPAWDSVTRKEGLDPLPADSPSRRSEELLRRAFPDSYAGSSVVLVVRRAETLRAEDRQFVEQVLASRLKELAGHTGSDESIVQRIRTFAEPGAGALLVSQDNKATLVLIELSTSFTDPRNQRVIEQVEALLTDLRREGEVPDGLQLALTGSATAGRDLWQAERRSADTVEVWTIGVVVVLLLLLYRAPLAALVPLLTVFVAVQVSLKLLALLAVAGVLTLFQDVRVFITVLLYGAGVDYCIFLTARYREELDAGSEPAPAVANAIARVGGAICASAATVIGGVATLSLGRFVKIQQAGLVIPLALLIALVACLTFTPSVLLLARRWLFWPQPITGPDDSRDATPGLLSRLLRRPLIPDVWQRLGGALLRRPGTVWLFSVAAMTPFVVLGAVRYNDQNYNPISDLPPSAPSSVGTRALEEHFPPGALGSVTVLLRNEEVDFREAAGIELIGRLTSRVRDRHDELDVADVRSVAEPLGHTPAGQAALADLRAPAEVVQATLRRRAVEHYVSHAGELAGHVTRIELTLTVDVFSRRAIDTLNRIEAALRESLPAELQGSQIQIAGATATARDVAAIKRGDQTRVEVLVPIVVFVLLLFVLRRAVISLYLVLSVLFSFFATLGLTFLVFRLVEGQAFAGLDWKVPIFLFTILVAVGEDYNIFLVTRIREEQETHGPLQGIVVALARTGRIISSCGFIMAGTFASLLSGSLLAMKELGFALAVGVLLDTLVVRPILVPAFLILLQDRTLGRVGQALALRDARTHARATGR